MIYREAAICHHCNTIQNGAELVQAKVETARAVPEGRREKKNVTYQVMLLLVSAIVLIALGVAIAVWFIQNT